MALVALLQASLKLVTIENRDLTTARPIHKTKALCNTLMIKHLTLIVRASHPNKLTYKVRLTIYSHTFKFIQDSINNSLNLRLIVRISQLVFLPSS